MARVIQHSDLHHESYADKAIRLANAPRSAASRYESLYRQSPAFWSPYTHETFQGIWQNPACSQEGKSWATKPHWLPTRIRLHKHFSVEKPTLKIAAGATHLVLTEYFKKSMNTRHSSVSTTNLLCLLFCSMLKVVLILPTTRRENHASSMYTASIHRGREVSPK